ncbi:MAG: CYTH domain-containing protein [Prolixibacteraceae bacterium]|jgi:adenylate cyclase|nr:CYTH domain-containing protein [Prolixibacteraceae bacterium]
MPLEIERKFLVIKEKMAIHVSGMYLCQAYLTDDPGRTVRIRIAGEQAFLTIKGPVNSISRSEFEYPVPVSEAREIMKLAIFPPVEKTRYKIRHEDFWWELDIFHGSNEGLLLAELELDSEDQEITLPPWIGREVSGDPRYFNSYLAKFPFRTWAENNLV